MRWQLEILWVSGENTLSPRKPPFPVSQGLFTALHVPRQGLWLTLPSNCHIWMLMDWQGLGLLGPYLALGCDCPLPLLQGVRSHLSQLLTFT